mgnify:CR=1 FL=1
MRNSTCTETRHTLEGFIIIWSSIVSQAMGMGMSALSSCHCCKLQLLDIPVSIRGCSASSYLQPIFELHVQRAQLTK